MAPEQLENHAVGPSADVGPRHRAARMSHRRAGLRGTPSEVLARRMAGPVTLPDGLPVPWKLLLTGMLAPRPRTASVRSTCRRCSRHRPSAPLGSIDPVERHHDNRRRPRQYTGGQDGETSIRAPRASPMAPRTAPKQTTNVRNARVIAILVLVVILGGIGIAFALDRRTLRSRRPQSRRRRPKLLRRPRLAFDFALPDQDGE